MKTYFLSDALQSQIKALLRNNKYNECKSLIMDLKRKLHVLYAEVEVSEKEYANSKQLKLF